MQHSTTSVATQQEIKALYRHFREIKGLLRQLGCDAVTAEDIFQEALIIYLRRKEEPGFEFHQSPLAYITNTCKYLWFGMARKQPQQGTLSEDRFADADAMDQEWIEKEVQYKALEKALMLIDEKCRELLHLFYGLGWNMVDIAKKIGLRNDKVAKAQKYRCIQKAKTLVQEAPLDVESISF